MEYIARNLGSLAGKPTPEDLNRERFFLNIIFEDFEIDMGVCWINNKVEN